MSHYETKAINDDKSSEVAHSNSKYRLKSTE